MNIERDLRQHYAMIFPDEEFPGVANAIHFLAAEIKLLRAVIEGHESRRRVQQMDGARGILRGATDFTEPFHG